MSDYVFPNIEELLAQKGEAITSTAGLSMYPMLRNRRDMVVIKKPCRELSRNDVPLYRMKSGKLVLHRILSVKGDKYIIRGDNLYAKEIVDKNQIIGVLSSFYRGGKFYDCETNKIYKLYVVLMRLTYPLRFTFAKVIRPVIRPVLSKIKHLIIKK